MARAVWKRCGCLLLCLLGLAAVAAVPCQKIIWDGGFASAEYRLTFSDEDGRPVPGVVLRVETHSGGACHLYPVDEFLPGLAPTSDAEGHMVFHHAGTSMEFGGRESVNLLGMRFGETGAPQYVCVFSTGGREVWRVRYDDLRPRGDDRGRLPKITRGWQHTDWPLREYVAHHDEWSAHRRRLFDGNGDGELDREERTAAGYFERLMEFDREKKEIEFVIVERAITVKSR